ncbi:putative HTH-type transcriptional regulator ydfH [Proteiniborus sp. DW1]|uniref:GntR family transcriptional regulator n=1 Tax=Proteiniborus sp. DW1 TaxID=1889883 RepID=UPI00092E0656|nr:GntR family transcriptional regulator [Proteiniborus sp. DW1]SCG82056.1 putative HTH-type transcriptional regulator ydfH [Proteiniborus sp. DW1]
MTKKIDSDEIYKLLKRRIIELEYRPGEVLNEVDVADEFEISRTPIRKVFQQLSDDKLLNIIPRFGAQVTPIDFRYMKSVFEVTREIDPFATRLAVERISNENLKRLEAIVDRLNQYDIESDYQKAIDDDEEFHRIISESCGNPCLSEILERLHIHTERLWHYSEQFFNSMDLFTNTLSKVVKAIKEKDTANAEKYAREHIDEFVEKIKQELL